MVELGRAFIKGAFSYVSESRISIMDNYSPLW
nr:MAG TPA: hypothetical protein [Caudoviricetes sp.]